MLKPELPAAEVPPMSPFDQPDGNAPSTEAVVALACVELALSPLMFTALTT